MFFLRPSGSKWVDLGDKTDYDYDQTDFTTDGTYHNLDISSIVGKRKCLVMIRAWVSCVEVTSFFGFRTNGYSGNFNLDGVYILVTALPHRKCLWVMTDDNGVIQYRGDDSSWVSIQITICGYFKP